MQVEHRLATRRNVQCLAQLRRRLAADGLSLERFRTDLRNQLLLTRLRERDVDGRVRVTDLDIDQFIREQQASVDQTGVEMNLGHVLVVALAGLWLVVASRTLAGAWRGELFVSPCIAGCTGK